MTTNERKVAVECVTSEKDLGVTVDNKLEFRDHINSKLSIANRNPGIIFRTFTYLDKEVFLNLYKSFMQMQWWTILEEISKYWHFSHFFQQLPFDAL